MANTLIDLLSAHSNCYLDQMGNPEPISVPEFINTFSKTNTKYGIALIHDAEIDKNGHIWISNENNILFASGITIF